MKFLAFLLLFPLTSQAALLEADLFEPGDALLTVDTETGLEWLDIREPQGLSFDEVVGGAGGWGDLGFRYAELDDVCGLWNSLGVPLCLPAGGPNGFANDGQALRFFELFDEPGEDPRTELIVYSDGAPEDGEVSWAMILARTFVADIKLDNLDTGTDDPRDSHYLIRDVPEPSTLALLLLTAFLWRRTR